MAKLLLLNGPNLNLLGTREPQLYGARTLSQIERDLVELAQSSGHDLDCFQSNHEGDLVDAIQDAKGHDIDFILINPGAYTHTSVAIRDAFSGVGIPFIEIHLSNIHAREPFRHHSYLSDIASGVIVGFGELGYRMGLQAALEQLQKGD